MSNTLTPESPSKTDEHDENESSVVQKVQNDEGTED